MNDFTIIGAGIVGLAVAREILQREPWARVMVVDKEQTVASHQTGHNSGVIHSGIYYAPGSLKAKLGRDGNRAMVAYCQTRGIAHEVCGKLIVATREDELGRLSDLEDRAHRNEIETHRLNPSEARAIEPSVQCVGALHVPSTGVVDYSAVSTAFADDIRYAGGEIVLGQAIDRIESVDGARVLHAGATRLRTKRVVNCAGLQSDRVARLDGVRPRARVIPFRGDYWELKPERRHLVRSLVYPVPDPLLPFLGVHLTRGIDGSVHAGPNAVLSFAREGYGHFDIDLRDTFGMLIDPAFWRMAIRYAGAGAREYARLVQRNGVLRELQRMVPAITRDDLIPSTSGIRAQAVDDHGRLVDDFLLVESDGTLHVCNAPSPAATASLEIARVVVDRLMETCEEGET